MTIITYQDYEDNQIFSSASFVEVISKSFDVNRDGEYIINVYCEATTSNPASIVSLRVLLNTVEGARDDFSIPAANLPHAFSTFRTAHVTSGTHYLSLEIKSSNAADTLTVRRIRVYVMKH